MPTDRERGVERLIDLAEQALVAGDEARAFSLASQARALSPGDVRIQRLFQTDAAAGSRRGTILIVVGAVVIIASLAAVALIVVIN